MSDAAVQVTHNEPIFQGFARGKLALWFFLASEVMFFTGLLGAFVSLKTGNPLPFYEGQKELSWKMAALNTALLITSSLTMALAVAGSKRGDAKKATLNLALTILLACGFLVVKYFEYTAKFHHGIYPKTSIFFSCYFTITGFHGLHVIGGIVPLALLWMQAFRGKLMPAHTEYVGLYWHFVDLVWIFLFPLFYLLPISLG